MVTIKDVARVAGVSPATASRVIGGYGYAKESTRQRVQEAAAKLGYRPNALARSMVKRSTQTIGLIISDIANPFFPEVVRGIEDLSQRRGFNVILCNSDEDSEKEKSYIDVLVAKRVDGLIVASTVANAQHFVELRKSQMPVVLLDRYIRKGGFDAVKVDNSVGAFNAVSHLIELGHQRIGIVTGPNRIPTARERLDGYKQALDQNGLPLDEGLIFQGDFKESGGYEGIKHLMALTPPPTAIFTTNNRTTTGAITAIKELRIEIPDQLSIIGFDDMAWMQLIEPQLSVVQQPGYLLGTAAAELLFQRLGHTGSKEPQIVQLQSNLVLRDSCAPPANAYRY